MREGIAFFKLLREHHFTFVGTEPPPSSTTMARLRSLLPTSITGAFVFIVYALMICVCLVSFVYSAGSGLGQTPSFVPFQRELTQAQVYMAKVPRGTQLSMEELEEIQSLARNQGEAVKGIVDGLQPKYNQAYEAHKQAAEHHAFGSPLSLKQSKQNQAMWDEFTRLFENTKQAADKMDEFLRLITEEARKSYEKLGEPKGKP